MQDFLMGVAVGAVVLTVLYAGITAWLIDPSDEVVELCTRVDNLTRENTRLKWKLHEQSAMFVETKEGAD